MARSGNYLDESGGDAGSASLRSRSTSAHHSAVLSLFAGGPHCASGTAGAASARESIAPTNEGQSKTRGDGQQSLKTAYDES